MCPCRSRRGLRVPADGANESGCAGAAFAAEPWLTSSQRADRLLAECLICGTVQHRPMILHTSRYSRLGKPRSYDFGSSSVDSLAFPVPLRLKVGPIPVSGRSPQRLRPPTDGRPVTICGRRVTTYVGRLGSGLRRRWLHLAGEGDAAASQSDTLAPGTGTTVPVPT
jgi:hypothetical protein